jgi:RNA polymerase sigma-70 factor (ECF subfamily)
MQTDEELMATYARGDQAAFHELFLRFSPVLLGLFRRQGAQPDDAQDLLQQTFLHLHRARLDFEQGNLVRPWLFTIALNVRREMGRKRARRREGALEQEPAANASSVSQAIESSEDAARVRQGLGALPDAQREVIELHWFQGVAFAEIASIVGASVSAVKVRAHRGYERLRELLGDGTAPAGRSASVPEGLADGT